MKFQVGDRVSVEAVVLDPYSGHLTCIQFDYGDEVDVPTAYVTLVERPKRKLRVGSEWACKGMGNIRWHVVRDDVFAVVDPYRSVEIIGRALTSFDDTPEDWREVPVEELEREAK